MFLRSKGRRWEKILLLNLPPFEDAHHPRSRPLTGLLLPESQLQLKQSGRIPAHTKQRLRL
jgi:hypothetical protein